MQIPISYVQTRGQNYPIEGGIFRSLGGGAPAGGGHWGSGAKFAPSRRRLDVQEQISPSALENFLYCLAKIT